VSKGIALFIGALNRVTWMTVKTY